MMITPCGRNISFYSVFPRTTLSSAHANPCCNHPTIGNKKANVFPDPLTARINKLNFLRAGSMAISNAYSCTLVGFCLF
jgi:hypothetical protein